MFDITLIVFTWLYNVNQTKSVHINDLMAKHRHILDLMANIILSSLVPFGQLVFKSDRGKIDELFPRI